MPEESEIKEDFTGRFYEKYLEDIEDDCIPLEDQRYVADTIYSFEKIKHEIYQLPRGRFYFIFIAGLRTLRATMNNDREIIADTLVGRRFSLRYL